ncbi:hypothetical protein GCM10022221_18270 [Actinocorallia aurea]
MTKTDWIIRILAAVVVVALGLVAAVVSYNHALEVAQAHGQEGFTALLTPLTIDGLVLVPGLVMLDSARRGERAPWLAYASLALGIGATLGVNVLYGIGYGLVGAIVAGWPAVALVLASELLMGMIRRSGLSSHAAGRDESLMAAAADLDQEVAELLRVDPEKADLVEVVDAARSIPTLAETVPDDEPPAPFPPVEVDREIDTPVEGAAAGEGSVTGLDSAIVSARRAGRTIKDVCAEFGVSRYRVDKAMKAAALAGVAL